MDEIFWHKAPAAVCRGHLTVLQGKQRNAMMYGMPAHGGKQLGGVNGGVILIRSSHAEFDDMMEHLNRYKLQGQGAEQNILTDVWKDRGGIHTLPRRYNCELHQVALIVPTV